MLCRIKSYDTEIDGCLFFSDIIGDEKFLSPMYEYNERSDIGVSVLCVCMGRVLVQHVSWRVVAHNKSMHFIIENMAYHKELYHESHYFDLRRCIAQETRDAFLFPYLFTEERDKFIMEFLDILYLPQEKFGDNFDRNFSIRELKPSFSFYNFLGH